MNKVFYATLAALSLAFAACNDQAEGNQNPVDPDGKVGFTLNVGIPKGITTYASNNGGATNVDADDYDLRYIVEVWSKDASPVLITRRSQTVAKDFKTTEAVFNLHLPPANYDFVFWADFVDEGATKDKFYKTSASTGSDEEDVEASAAAVGNGLTAIEILPTGTDYPNVCNDARDAFYATKTFDLTSASVTENITLKRPFGKFRLVSKTLLDTFDFDIDDYTAKLEYVRSTTSLPAGFNAKTGAVDVSKTLPPATAGYTNTIVKEDVVAGGTTYKNAAVVLYDYVFAPSGQVVDFDATVYQNTSTQVSKLQLASIPISENKLTTILVDNIFGGNTANFTIIVDDPFDEDTVVNSNDYVLVPNDGVRINGVIWAKYNVGAPGTFAASPESSGMLYKWNTNVGWSVSEPVEDSNSGSIWDSSTPAGARWETANDPSPSGWRVPTYDEFNSLLDNAKVSSAFTTQSSVDGMLFTDLTTGATLFLPADGYRFASTGTLYGEDTNGYYWSSTQSDNSNAWALTFATGSASMGGNDLGHGFNVRPVYK